MRAAFRSAFACAGALAACLLAGCVGGPALVPADQQTSIDRKLVEYPAGTELIPYIGGLTAPTAIAFDTDGTLLIAEGGLDGNTARILALRKSGEMVEVWPKARRLPFGGGYRPDGPIGGIVAAHGRIYVTHRDGEGRGTVSQIDYDGNHKTIVADLPAQGDHGVTDIAVGKDGRLFFGVGSATNSGVVGLDNLGWMRRYRDVCDAPWTDQFTPSVYLNGWRFNTSNPFAGLFGGSDVAVTAPFQPFGQSVETRIARARNGKPNAAIYSVNADGGDLRVEAHGIRYPAGLAFTEYGRLYMTNQGMKLRGTRPVKDDPDVLLRLVSGAWYGWPDFSANMLPIQEARFQPPQDMLVKSGYRELSFLLDHGRSNLRPPERRQQNLLAAEFQPLSGAAKLDFVPSSGPLARLRQGRDMAIVALSGDLAPFDTGGLALTGPIGYRLVAVRLEGSRASVEDFIHNTRQGPVSRLRPRAPIGLERPFDVKFGPDGALYIVDLGKVEMYDARMRVTPGTGRIFRLSGAAAPTTSR